MRKDFDPARLYNRLPYGTTVPSHCPDLLDISIDCRVDPDWIERNLVNTPFVPVSDRIVISASDFANNKVVPFRDVTIMAAVEYKGMLGGHPIMEFENLNRLVMGGREKWGYPKLYADISFADTPDGGVEVVVTMGSHKVIEMSWHPGEAPAPAEPAPAIKLVPHFTLRTLPSPSSPGMSFAEVLARDTSPDSKLKEQNAGKGSIKFNAWPQNEWDHTRLGGLAVKEIVSANRTVLDWYATEENGWARLVDRLI